MMWRGRGPPTAGLAVELVEAALGRFAKRVAPLLSKKSDTRSKAASVMAAVDFGIEGTHFRDMDSLIRPVLPACMTGSLPASV